jgi:hypothetical protein
MTAHRKSDRRRWLSLAQKSRRTELENVIERGLSTFVEVGNALLEIRDSKLYRETHPTFEAYLHPATICEACAIL